MQYFSKNNRKFIDILIQLKGLFEEPEIENPIHSAINPTITLVAQTKRLFEFHLLVYSFGWPNRDKQESELVTST